MLRGNSTDITSYRPVATSSALGGLRHCGAPSCKLARVGLGAPANLLRVNFTIRPGILCARISERPTPQSSGHSDVRLSLTITTDVLPGCQGTER